MITTKQVAIKIESIIQYLNHLYAMLENVYITLLLFVVFTHQQITLTPFCRYICQIVTSTICLFVDSIFVKRTFVKFSVMKVKGHLKTARITGVFY